MEETKQLKLRRGSQVSMCSGLYYLINILNLIITIIIWQ